MKLNNGLIQKSFKPDILKKMFLLFYDKLPQFYIRNINKTIPFVIAELVLCNHRITKEDAKEILKQFVNQGYLELVKFKGFRINSGKISGFTDFKKFYGSNKTNDRIYWRYHKQIEELEEKK